MLQLADHDDAGSRMETRPGAELDDVLEVTLQLEPLLDAKVKHAREQQRVRQARYMLSESSRRCILSGVSSHQQSNRLQLALGFNSEKL